MRSHKKDCSVDAYIYLWMCHFSVAMSQQKVRSVHAEYFKVFTNKIIFFLEKMYLLRWALFTEYPLGRTSLCEHLRYSKIEYALFFFSKELVSAWIFYL